MKGGRQEVAQEVIDLRCPRGSISELGCGPASMDFLRGAWERQHLRMKARLPEAQGGRTRQPRDVERDRRAEWSHRQSQSHLSSQTRLL